MVTPPDNKRIVTDDVLASTLTTGDIANRDRRNHTNFQPISSVTNLQTTIDAQASLIAQLKVAVETLGGKVGPDVPSVPLSVRTTTTQTTASVNWAAPASNGGSALTGYTVTLLLAASGATVASFTVATTVLSQNFTGLTPNTAYTVVVRANNAAGAGAAASVAATTLNNVTDPNDAKPTLSLTDITATTAVLDWANPVSPEPGQTIIARRFGWDTTATTPAQSWQSADIVSPADPYTITNLTGSTAYKLWVEMVYQGTGSTGPAVLQGPLAFTGADGAAPTAGVIGGGFTGTGATVAISGNMLRFTTGASAAYTATGRVVRQWQIGGTAISRANVQQQMTVRMSAGAWGRILACASATGDNFPASYTLNFQPGNQGVWVERISASTSTTLGTAAMPTGATFEVDFRVYNGLVQVWLWNTGTTKPTSPTISAQDTAPLAAGYAGVQVSPGSADGPQTFDVDNVTILDGAPATSGGVAGPRATVTATTDPPPADNFSGSRLMALYWNKWNGPKITTITALKTNSVSRYNLMYAFVAWSAQANTGKVAWQPDWYISDMSGVAHGGDAQFLADKAASETAGAKWILTVGGGTDTGFVINTTADATAFVTSVKPIIDKYGFDGVDFDMESPFTAAALANAAGQLKTAYGSNFLISMVPRPWETTPFDAAKAMGSNLDLFGMQFYDAPDYSTFKGGADYIRGYVSKAVNTYGIPASKILLGFIGPGYSGQGAVTLDLANQYYNDIKGTYSTIRGVFHYDSPIEAANNWTMSGQYPTVRGTA